MLLRDRTGPQVVRPGIDEDLTTRLRAALDRPAGRERRGHLPFVPGLDAGGNPFTRTDTTVEHGGL
ncbi:hypothetical protein GCM10009558_108620 [Virgisporangium aurantiacum]